MLRRSRRPISFPPSRAASTFRISSQVTRHSSPSFTLIELMVVIGIIVLLTVLVVPAFNSLKSSKDITNVVYTVKGAMEQAHAYALVNNTYVWIGFFEESGAVASTKPPTAGTGRIVICTVASKDG